MSARAHWRGPSSRHQPVSVWKLFTFTLANEIYAIQARYALAVFRLAELALLPGAVPPLLGVTAWRGELLTILDVRGALGLSSSALNDLSHVLVLGRDRAAFGLLADAAQGLMTVAATDVHPPRNGVAIRQGLIYGVTDEAVLVLDGPRLFQSVGASIS